MIKSITDFDLAEKRVFIRVDFNCPIADGRVTDDTRIRAALPTITHALEQKAKVILASHLGRPKGEGFEAQYSLAPVGERLAELLDGVDILLPEDCAGDGPRKLVTTMQPGQVMLLENLRFHAGEKSQDPVFAKRLADLADVYINDAFGAAHRAHASVVDVPALVTERGAGFLMHKELETLSQLLDNPARPFVAVLGGAKVSDKLGIIEHLLRYVDGVIVGGGMAYTFLKSKGIAVGSSLLDEERVFSSGKMLERAKNKGTDFLLPRDHVIAQGPDGTPDVTSTNEIPADWAGFDIGPKTIARFTEYLAGAKTILWNGPMGMFENPAFAEGTNAVAQAIAAGTATSVVGGGDSVAALQQSGLADKITHISTGGGASLAFLEGQTLPGVAALES